MKARALWLPLLLGPAAAASAWACSHGPASSTPQAPPYITIASRETLFVVREHMMAALEMQLSGEPLATAMGRELTAYSRNWIPPNIYFDPSPASFGPRIDLPGFASAIESYEYSKQPMNNLAFESGAGVSLTYGPVLNPSGASGASACALLRQTVQHLGGASYATASFVDATVTPENPLGWPGIWPTMEPFESFDPSITPTNSISESCSITSDDDPGATGALLSDDYECDATTLHLPDRAAQVDSVISPGSSGWAGWKSALWTMNYLQIMHDVDEVAITDVPEAQLSQVGMPGNTVLATTNPSASLGTYLGSSDIEGFQAGMMLTALDNEAEDWLTARTTTDGTTLGGFDGAMGPLHYDARAPLRWFPAEITVTESPDPGCVFPRPTGYAIRSAGSRLLDLAGLLGTYSSLYALTDTANATVGGSQPCRAYFDGDPFPADDQLADGQPTLHDRSLSMIRVALVNLLRMHLDPASGVPVDDATVDAGAVVRGTTLSATTAAYTLLALRTTRRSLSDQLVLYLNMEPDTAMVSTPLDVPPLGLPPPLDTTTDALNTLVATLANLFYDDLTDATGRAWPGWDVSAATPTSAEDTLDAHTAAVRGLLLAYLSTGDTKFRDRALAVYQRVESTFWDPVVRLYRPVAGDTSETITYTPVRFGLVEAMLRDVYELIASKDGDTALASQVLGRLARVDKLVLNGWDDRNDNQVVDYPGECVQVYDGLPRGGLQMGERTLSGESGSANPAPDGGRIVSADREADCVPEISAAGLPSALADSIVFQITSASP